LITKKIEDNIVEKVKKILILIIINKNYLKAMLARAKTKIFAKITIKIILIIFFA